MATSQTRDFKNRTTERYESSHLTLTWKRIKAAPQVLCTDLKALTKSCILRLINYLLRGGLGRKDAERDASEMLVQLQPLHPNCLYSL